MANRDKRSEDIEIDFSQDSGYKKGTSKKSKAKIIKEGNTKNPNKKNKKPSKLALKFKSLKKWQRVLIIVVIVILLLAGIASAVFFGVLNGFRGEKIDDNDVGISDEINSTYSDSGIINIALFGLDTRDENSFNGRSDTIMIFSINKATNDVKITSILRDSYVAIDGYKNQKITHAYALGGAKLALKTLNKNYNMNITDYVTVNFAKVADAIDSIGGIDIEITEKERIEVNNIGDDENSNFHYVKSSGMVHMIGEQAVVYARIRHIDSDNARVERQKRVLMAALEKIKTISPTKYSDMVKSAMSLCETSLSASEILSFAPMITKPITISTLVIPGDEDNAIGGTYEGAWVWRYDLVAASNRLHKFIYNDKAVTITGTSTTKNSSSGGSGNSNNSNNSNNSGNNNSNNSGNNSNNGNGDDSKGSNGGNDNGNTPATNPGAEPTDPGTTKPPEKETDTTAEPTTVSTTTASTAPNDDNNKNQNE